MFTFIDGEYWGEYQILERYSTHYIEEHFGVDKDNVSIIKMICLNQENRLALMITKFIIIYGEL